MECKPAARFPHREGPLAFLQEPHTCPLCLMVRRLHLASYLIFASHEQEDKNELLHYKRRNTHSLKWLDPGATDDLKFALAVPLGVYH